MARRCRARRSVSAETPSMAAASRSASRRGIGETLKRCLAVMMLFRRRLARSERGDIKSINRFKSPLSTRFATPKARGKIGVRRILQHVAA
jgi:hypothetical protein